MSLQFTCPICGSDIIFSPQYDNAKIFHCGYYLGKDSPYINFEQTEEEKELYKQNQLLLIKHGIYPKRYIYISKKSEVYIQEVKHCGSRGELRKTRLFRVRKDGKGDLSDIKELLLGTIKFSGAWRQFVFEPEPYTMWSTGCLEGVKSFCDTCTEDWKSNLNNKI